MLLGLVVDVLVAIVLIGVAERTLDSAVLLVFVFVFWMYRCPARSRTLGLLWRPA